MNKVLLNSIVFAIALVLVAASLPVGAVEPLWKEDFNIKTEFDLNALTQENFYEVMVPLAKAEGSFVFFDFSNSFAPLWTEHIIPLFEKEYGIKVQHNSVKGDVALQQMLAARNAGQPSPSQVYKENL